MTKTKIETETCEGCGMQFQLNDLDSKPKRLRNILATIEMLREAADQGEHFDCLQCRKCYGPAFNQGDT